MSQTEPVGDAFRTELDGYLRATRPASARKIGFRLERRERSGTRVIGLRRSGHEALLYDPETATGEAVLSVHDVLSSGRLPQRAEVWRERDLERWLERHHHYLEWVHPDFRR